MGQVQGNPKQKPGTELVEIAQTNDEKAGTNSHMDLDETSKLDPKVQKFLLDASQYTCISRDLSVPVTKVIFLFLQKKCCKTSQIKEERRAEERIFRKKTWIFSNF